MRVPISRRKPRQSAKSMRFWNYVEGCQSSIKSRRCGRPLSPNCQEAAHRQTLSKRCIERPREPRHVEFTEPPHRAAGVLRPTDLQRDLLTKLHGYSQNPCDFASSKNRHLQVETLKTRGLRTTQRMATPPPASGTRRRGRREEKKRIVADRRDAARLTGPRVPSRMRRVASAIPPVENCHAWVIDAKDENRIAVAETDLPR